MANESPQPQQEPPEQKTPQPEPPQQKTPQQEPPQPKKRKKIFLILLIVLIILGAWFGISKYLHAKHHEDPDDAQIAADISPIISRVSGNHRDFVWK